MIPLVVAIICEGLIGVVYDVIGRKKPLAVSYLLTSSGILVMIVGT